MNTILKGRLAVVFRSIVWCSVAVCVIASTGCSSVQIRGGDSAAGQYSCKVNVFPLFKYYKSVAPSTGTTNVNGSFLLVVYKHQHDINSNPANEYTRNHFLGPLCKYENRNHNVDMRIIPGMRYEDKTDGYTKTAFLWRVFRYEHSAHETDMDVLFLPVYRSYH